MSATDFRHLAAACLFPALRQTQFRVDNNYQETILKLADEGVGGFCIFQGELQETAKIIASLQQRSSNNLLFCADFEHGLPMRLDGGTPFPHAMALGHADNIELTKNSARAIAQEMKALGVAWNFAPVCDVNSNRLNPIINIRSFGETPKIVARHAEAYISGLQSEGVIACAKHFPGHGDTAFDSHLTMPILPHNLSRLDNVELAPFRAAITAGVRSVMVAHLAVEAFDYAHIPASLSSHITADLLRCKLGFNGIIVTDALEMQAITRSYSSAEAALAAIRAGADAVLIPENTMYALNALAEEAERDENFTEMLKNASKRISINREWTKSSVRSSSNAQTQQHAELALTIAKSAISITDPQTILPLNQYNSFAALAYCPDEDMDVGTEFFRYLAQTLENDCDFGYIDDSLTNEEAITIETELAEADIIVVGFFVRSRAYRGNVNLGEHIMPKLRQIIKNRPFIAALFGSPYLDETINADCTIYCYSDVSASIGAAALALAGKLS